MYRVLVVLTLLAIVSLSGCSLTRSTSCADVLHLKNKAHPPKWIKARINRKAPNEFNTDVALISPFELLPLSASQGISPEKLLNQIAFASPLESAMVDSLLIKNDPVPIFTEPTLKPTADLTLESDTTGVSQFDENFLKAKKQAQISFWSSIAGVLGTSIPFIFIPAVVISYITASKSLKRYKKSLNKKGRGLAVAALWINSLWLAFLLLVVILVLLFFFNVGLT